MLLLRKKEREQCILFFWGRLSALYREVRQTPATPWENRALRLMLKALQCYLHMHVGGILMGPSDMFVALLSAVYAVDLLLLPRVAACHWSRCTAWGRQKKCVVIVPRFVLEHRARTLSENYAFVVWLRAVVLFGTIAGRGGQGGIRVLPGKACCLHL